MRFKLSMAGAALLTAALLLHLCGCGATGRGNGPLPAWARMPVKVANFATVAPGIYRGGQPNDAAWEWMRSCLGVSNVVKLDLETEGSDAYAESLGMMVRRFPITIEEQLVPSKFLNEPSDATAPIERQPMAWKVCDASGAIQPGTYVHCLHGQDRTGLVVAFWKLEMGTNYAAAQADMMGHGFHKELWGLWEFWEHCGGGNKQ